MSVTKAIALLQAGDIVGADKLLREVLAADPDNFDALNAVAGVRSQTGDLAGAVACLEAAIKVDPSNAIAQFNYGNMLLRLQRTEEAAAAFVSATKISPRYADAWANRCAVLLMLGRSEEVVAGCDEALRNGVDGFTIHYNRAVALARLNRHSEALANAERAVALKEDAGAYANLGMIFMALRRPEEAADAYTAATRLNPLFAPAWSDLAAAFLEIGRDTEALASVDRALALEPANSTAHYNRGLILAALERYAEAGAAFEQMKASVGGDSAVTWNYVAGALLALGRRDEAIEAYARAAAAGPSGPLRGGPALYNKALLLLAKGEWAEGFALYEHRFESQRAEAPAHLERVPEWNGAPVDGVLEIWGEQGVGDQLLFLRLLPLVAARTNRIRLSVDERLVPMIKRAFPALDTTAVKPAAQISQGSIARVLRLTPDDVANQPTLLCANPEKTATLRARYRDLSNGKPAIGFAWRSTRARYVTQKSAPLSHWGPLLKRDAWFVNLQCGDASDEIAEAEHTFGCRIYQDHSVDQLASIEDFAAQIAALDHVVTISNTTAHVAGAIGAPCTVLPPPALGLLWYWGGAGERTPWYPSLRLVRREVGISWKDQIARAADLALGTQSGAPKADP